MVAEILATQADITKTCDMIDFDLATLIMDIADCPFRFVVNRFFQKLYAAFCLWERISNIEIETRA